MDEEVRDKVLSGGQEAWVAWRLHQDTVSSLTIEDSIPLAPAHPLTLDVVRMLLHHLQDLIRGRDKDWVPSFRHESRILLRIMDVALAALGPGMQ